MSNCRAKALAHKISLEAVNKNLEVYCNVMKDIDSCAKINTIHYLETSGTASYSRTTVPEDLLNICQSTGCKNTGTLTVNGTQGASAKFSSISDATYYYAGLVYYYVKIENFVAGENGTPVTYKVTTKISDLKELISTVDVNDEEMALLVSSEFEDARKELNELKKLVLFSGEYDSQDCVLEIHPGAGGTEACDWANMLLRMYTRFCEIHHFRYQVMDYLPGEEAGVKSVTLLIEGKNVYGMLKGEKGVHRLVRISPFDSNARRHTSFASVNLIPQFDNDVKVDINPSDLKIDTYRSGGAGGQNVNKKNI